MSREHMPEVWVPLKIKDVPVRNKEGQILLLSDLDIVTASLSVLMLRNALPGAFRRNSSGFHQV